MGVRGASSKLKRAARRMIVAACASFSSSNPPPLSLHSSFNNLQISVSPQTTEPKKVTKESRSSTEEFEAESTTDFYDSNVASKHLCAICLEALTFGTGNSPGPAIFTAQCSHSFHFDCISSNVRHGSVTCPICRAQWSQLPRSLNAPCSLSCNQNDPIFQILDESIATFRVHRRSFLRSARYDDDDPIEPDNAHNQPRLRFSLTQVPPAVFHRPYMHYLRGSHYHHQHDLGSSLSLHPQNSHLFTSSSTRRAAAAYLSVKLANPPATDLVLVASPNGPHLRLVKQSMALVVFSLRSIDRLAIVTYSSAAARVFPLRRMTFYGKRTALQVIDRLFYMGQADPIEGLKKGTKILEDRAHKNSHSCILHLSDSPTRSYHTMNMQFPIPIHRFHVGFGFGMSNGFIMHEFDEFLARLLGGVIKDVQLRIGEETRIVRLGELRGHDERRILVDLGECEHLNVAYSYIEGGSGECSSTGETRVLLSDEAEANNGNGDTDTSSGVSIVGGRSSNFESWEYHDPYMARRWAKHLHGYRL